MTGSKISTSSTKFVFCGPIRKTRWPPWPLIDWDIFDFSSETAERNLMKLDRKQDPNVLYQVCVFFGAIRKTRWPPWPLIGWDIFDFSSETAEWNSTKLDKKNDFLCFLGGSEKQDGHPGQSVKKVAHCTQVHDIWPFGPLVIQLCYQGGTERTAIWSSPWRQKRRFSIYKQYTKISRHSSYPDMDFKTY